MLVRSWGTSWPVCRKAVFYGLDASEVAVLSCADVSRAGRDQENGREEIVRWESLI
jgi:hypothetical protein